MSYLYNEIQAAFVGSGAYNIVRGRMFDADVSNFLDPRLYRYGFGVGGSYIAEAYAYWGLVGVTLVSIAIGLGLAFMSKHSGTFFSLFVVATTLPDVFNAPRFSDWLGVCADRETSFA